jgi:hypothetical protein
MDTGKRVVIPENIIMRKVGDDAVLLNLNTNQYYSLDGVGTQMVESLTSGASIQQASSSLVDEFDVDPDVLHSDLLDLIEQLVEQGLIEIV